MTALIAASAIRTCFGDGEQTFAALLRGESGAAPLRHFDGTKLNVGGGYQIGQDDEEALLQAGQWLGTCVREAVAASGVDPARQRVMAIVGSGLRELRTVERGAFEDVLPETESLHFDGAIRRVCPGVLQVITLSNACSAGGHALAVAQDFLDCGEADAVIAAAADGMTESMLAMIGRFALEPTDRVRPFDRERRGVLLGEGAAAAVLVPEGGSGRPLARLLSTGLSCDAVHETVPDPDGIFHAIDNAFVRAGRSFEDVDLVIAHGTGTLLNDPAEASLLCRELASTETIPRITAIKGAVGHTSGSAALMSLDVAIRCLRDGVVPPVIGLRSSIVEGERLRFVIGEPFHGALRLAQINAFGFGGVNAVTLVEAVA